MSVSPIVVTFQFSNFLLQLLLEKEHIGVYFLILEAEDSNKNIVTSQVSSIFWLVVSTYVLTVHPESLGMMILIWCNIFELG